MGKAKKWAQVIVGSNFEENCNFVRKVVWVVVVSVCCYFMVYQMEDCLSKLSNPPIVTQTNMTSMDALEYPAVTMCYKNDVDQGYDLNALKECNVSAYWINFKGGTYSDAAWTSFFNASSNPNMTEVWAKSSFIPFILPTVVSSSTTLNLMAIKVSLNNIPTSARGVSHETRFFHDHGTCITFKQPDHVEKPFPGERNGYKFYFATSGAIVPGAWDVFIHDPDEWWAENPLSSFRGEHLHLSTGQEVHIKLTKQIFSTLNRPDNPCAETVPEISYTECLERCRWELIAHQVNCCLPFMDVPGYEICTDEDPALTAMNYYRSWTDSVSKDQCRAKCVRPCNIKLYSTQITSQLKISDRLSRFHIFFQSGVVQNLHESWGYDTTLFIADFGGSLGFLLGVSILSALEIIEGLALSGYRFYINRKREKRRKMDMPTVPVSLDDKPKQF